MQFSYQLSAGRIGLSLDIFKNDESGSVVSMIVCSISKKGFEVRREIDEQTTSLCDFETFLYPEDIEDDEIVLVKTLTALLPEEEEAIRLCSVICGQWQAGHSEERIHETIRRTLSTW